MKFFIIILSFVLSSCSFIDRYGGIDIWEDSRKSTATAQENSIILYNNAKIQANYLLKYYTVNSYYEKVVNMLPLETKIISTENNPVVLSFVINERIGINIK